MLSALGRVVFNKSVLKAAANGRYLVCKSLDTILPFKFSVQKYIYPSVSKVHAGSFRVSVIHWTLTRTTGSSTCVRDYSYACVFTRGVGTPIPSQHTIFYLETLSQIVLVLLTQGSVAFRIRCGCPTRLSANCACQV